MIRYKHRNTVARMYIYKIIPLTKLPRPHMQMLTYFSVNKFYTGQIIEAPVGKRNIQGIIYREQEAENAKQEIRKAGFTLKKINRAVVKKPIFCKEFLDLAVHLADYYYTPVGLMMQRMLPPFFSTPTKPLLKMLEDLPEPVFATNKTSSKKRLIISPHKNKLYKKYIGDDGNLLIFPEYYNLKNAKNILKDVETLPKNAGRNRWRNLWEGSYKGEINNLAGTRSVIFSPMRKLSAVILDENNNSSHKSDTQHPKIDARYVSRVIAEKRGADFITGDILPTLELYKKAHEERWEIHKEMPRTVSPRVIDMSNELKEKNTSLLSIDLQNQLKTMNTGEKALLFINRRGLASALVCRDCGFVKECSECEKALVLHKGHVLICHHCGKKTTPPQVCEKCKGYRIKQLGGGTQKIAEEINKLMPELKTVRLDSDSAPTQKDRDNAFRAFKNEADVLIGTHIALKPSLLPDVDITASVMQDAILTLPMYNAEEQVFNILWHLKYIAKKNCIIQTYHPDMDVFKHAKEKDFEKFFSEELKKRKALNYPPYSQLIKLSYTHKNPEKAENEAKVLRKKIETQIEQLKAQNSTTARHNKIQILGPSPTVASKHSWYMLIKWPGKDKNLKLRNGMLRVIPSDWDIDVDPEDAV